MIFYAWSSHHGKNWRFCKKCKVWRGPFSIQFPINSDEKWKSFSFQSFPSDQMNIFYLLAAPLINLCSGGYLWGLGLMKTFLSHWLRKQKIIWKQFWRIIDESKRNGNLNSFKQIFNSNRIFNSSEIRSSNK